jgi:hypothetical protein
MTWSKFYVGGTKIGTYAAGGVVVYIVLVQEVPLAYFKRTSDGKYLGASQEKLVALGGAVVYESDFVLSDIAMLAMDGRLTNLYTDGGIGGVWLSGSVLGDWFVDFVPGAVDLVPGSEERLRNVSTWYKYGAYLPLAPVRNDVILAVDAIEDLVSREGLVYKAELKKPAAVGSSVLEVVEVLTGTEVPPRTEGDTVIMDGWRPDLGLYLDACLDWNAPKLTDGVMSLQPLVTMPFGVKTWAEQDGELIVGSEDVRDTIWGIKARINEEQFAGWRNGLYDKYIGENGRWLTWQPNGGIVDRDMPVFVSFLLNMVPTPTTVRLWVQVRFENGATEHWEVASLSNVVTNGVLNCAVGYKQLGLDVWEVSNNPVVYWNVWLVNEGMVRISRKRRYYLDSRARYGVRYLVFNNSLGGWDSIRCVGVYGSSLKVVGERARRGLDDRYTVGDEEVFVRNKKSELSVTLNSGYVDGKWLEYLEEVVWAERVLLVTNEGYVAVVMEAGDFAKRGYNEDLGGRTFVFRKSKDVVGFSALPRGTSDVERPTAWIPEGNYCLINAITGRKTGLLGAARLRQYYTDVSPMEKVKGVASKANVFGTEGYVAPQVSAVCVAGSADAYNVLISRQGNKKKDNCEFGQGTSALIVVAAGAFGGSTLAEANTRAEAEFARIDTQVYANANGGCSLDPEDYVMGGIPSLKWNWRWSLGVTLSNFYIQSFNVSTGGVISNAWFVQGSSTTPPNEIYATNSNDLKLLCAVPGGFAPYRIGVFGSASSYGVKVFVNGVLHREFTTGSGEVELFTFGYSIPDGGRVYVLVSP